MFKSEVRPSTISDLLTKAANKSYKQYLPKMVLSKVRGFSNEVISFDFPVTAIIGPNGGGKTTVLGAAGCAYKVIPPKRFFAKSGKYDESMVDWSIEYDLVDKSVNPRDVVRRTARFKAAKWKRDSLERPVLVFGVARTVPATESSSFRQCASSKFSVPASNIIAFTASVSTAVSRILGKDVSGFRALTLSKAGQIKLLTGVTAAGSGYSEFHFGAGESSIIRMVLEIETAPDSALILIEEIENGLHPVATIRLVEYLIEVAQRKRVQVIFTTHSNEALLPLPDKAIWVATRDRLFQGKLDVGSLRAITGQINKAAVVFVEDLFAKTWVEAILRQRHVEMFDSIEVHSMSGDGTAVAMNKYHNDNPAIRVPSICLIDGDSSQSTSEDNQVYRLPGSMPETTVFEEVMEAWSSVGGKLTVSLLQDFSRSDSIKKTCKDVRRTNMDPHLLFVQLGEKIGFVPESTVAAAFCTIWAQVKAAEADVVVSNIKSIATKDAA